MVSALNAMLKDVLPVSLVTNLRLEGKTLKEFFCDTRMLTQLDSKKDLHSIGHKFMLVKFSYAINLTIITFIYSTQRSLLDF